MTSINNNLILDCTLRDGGYINNWEFDIETAIALRDNLYKSGIRYIELGLIGKGGTPTKQTKFSNFSEVEPYLEGKQNDCSYAIISTLGEIKNNLLMIPEKSEKTVDIIRLAFFKQEVEDTLFLAEELKSKGYQVFLQAMATHMYNRVELLSLIDKVNVVNPASFYIVDSFSVFYPCEVKELTLTILEHLNPTIMLGFHAHNSLQLAVANVLSFFEIPTNRALIADASIFGMGRGAGNAPIELVMNYLNKKHKACYQPNYILSSYEKYLSTIYDNSSWGYGISQLLCATSQTNSAYVWYFNQKGSFTLEELSVLLDSIPNEEKFTLNKSLADNIISNFYSLH